MQPNLHSDTENKENKRKTYSFNGEISAKVLVENQQRITTTTNKERNKLEQQQHQTRNLTITSSRECVCLGQQIGPWFVKFCRNSILEPNGAKGQSKTYGNKIKNFTKVKGNQIKEKLCQKKSVFQP